MKRFCSFLFFLVGLSVLLGLAGWQIYRTEWKEGILRALEEEYRKDPFQSSLEECTNSFKICRGHLKGEFTGGQTLFWPKVKEGNFGFNLVDLFSVGESNFILVNRGWVHENSRTHEPMDVLAVPKQVVTLAGTMRPYKASFWALENDLQANRWYRFNEEDIARAYDISVKNLNQQMFFAEEIKPEGLEAFADVTKEQVYPPNNHMQYAFFWGALALLWAGIIGRKVFVSSN